MFPRAWFLGCCSLSSTPIHFLKLFSTPYLTFANFLTILSYSTEPLLLILTLFQSRQSVVLIVSEFWMESSKLKLNEEKMEAMVGAVGHGLAYWALGI